MEHKMHKADRQLSAAETLEVLKKGDHGTLSVNGDDGYPYATPVNYVVVDGRVYIHSAPYGYKIECLEKSRKCCFSAIVSAHIVPSEITATFESVVITGSVAFVEDEDKKRRALQEFITQKHAEYQEKGFKMVEAMIGRTALLRVDAVEMTGKAYRGSMVH